MSEDVSTLAKFAPKDASPQAWLKLIQEQLFSGKGKQPTIEEMIFYAQTCQATGLNPARKEIYAIYRGGKLTIQTGIDGMRAVAERSGKYGGSELPKFDYDAGLTVKVGGKEKKVPNTATVTVIKVVDGLPIKTSRSAQWEDYYPGDGVIGNMYRKFPEVMLAKCAEAQALRAAFPNLGKVYEEAEIVEDFTPAQASDEDKEQAKQEAMERLKEMSE